MTSLETRLRRLERILELSHELTFTTSLEPLLHRIMQAAVELTDSESAGILLLDERAGNLRFVAATNFTPQLAEICVPIQGSIAGNTFSTGEPLIVSDVRADPRYYKKVEEKTGYQAHSLLAVPLQFKERRIGVLEAENKLGGGEFNQEDVETLAALAAHATVAIENARLLEALQEARDGLERRVDERTAELSNANAALKKQIAARAQADEALRLRNRELAVLNQASQAFTSTLDLDQVLVTVLEQVRRLLDVVACAIWLSDPKSGALVCQQTAGPQSDFMRGWCLAPGEGLAGWVAENGESLIVPDVLAEERLPVSVERYTGLALRSVASVSLPVKHDVIGVLEAMDTQVGRFRPSDLTLLESLAASAAIAIDNARLVEALRQQTEELQAQNEDLDAFAHTVAHDLRNPLNLITGFAEVLRNDFTTMSDQDLHTYLHTIARNGRKMNNILHALLLLAGVRQMEVEIGALDMGSIVSEALQRLDVMIEEHQVDVVVPDSWPVALGFGPWVEEVWVNYLGNAIQYGGRPPCVELGFDRVDRSQTPTPESALIRFWVRDNGAGISPEAQSRLFRPFTRLDQARGKGHGLGLSIARRIVEKLGGQVGVESPGIPGQGSVFHFTLPTERL
jgi:signal transduction histidine kinase